METDSLEISLISNDQFEEAMQLWKSSEEIEVTIGDTKDSFVSYLKRNPGMSFVCKNKSNGNIIGTVLCGHDGRRGYIYHLTVDKNHRGKSIGTSLLQKSLDALKSEGIERCIIMVKVKNESVNAFWEKSGWKRRDDLTMYSIDLRS